MVDFDVVTGPAPPLRLPSREKPPPREAPRDVEKDASTNPQRNPSPPPGEREG
jgi:hypothetical protein